MGGPVAQRIEHLPPKQGVARSTRAGPTHRPVPFMDIPFFPNTGDGTHCLQAALKMALAVHMPGRSFTYEELDVISMKLPGLWTWPTAAMLWMMREGLSLKLIEEFDYRLFAERGEEYILERFGPEVGRAQIENSDIAREVEIARSFVEVAPIEVRAPGISDITREIDLGAVVVCNINSAALMGVAGYAGHFVVVCDVVGDLVTLHDPGLPPRPGLVVSTEEFEKAWAYPEGRDKNLLSIARAG